MAALWLRSGATRLDWNYAARVLLFLDRAAFAFAGFVVTDTASG
jgi:hypothetical protein